MKVPFNLEFPKARSRFEGKTLIFTYQRKINQNIFTISNLEIPKTLVIILSILNAKLGRKYLRNYVHILIRTILFYYKSYVKILTNFCIQLAVKITNSLALSTRQGTPKEALPKAPAGKARATFKRNILL